MEHLSGARPSRRCCGEDGDRDRSDEDPGGERRDEPAGQHRDRHHPGVEGENAPDHPPVVAHSRYFEPGSAALENMADVVTGQYGDVRRHRAAFPEIAGGLVAWALRMPVVPLRMAGRHYRGPGFRVLVNWTRLVELGASETGNLVSEVLDESERALLWFAHRVGAVPRPDHELDVDLEPDPDPPPGGPDPA